MFKWILRQIDDLLFGNLPVYSCTRCHASKEDIWTTGCPERRPCKTVPLDFNSPLRRWLLKNGILLA